MSVESETGNERPLLLPARETIVPLKCRKQTRLGPSRIVERIDRKRMADVSQMHADLVRFARLGKTSHQRVFAKSLLDLPVGDGGAAVFADVHSRFDGGVRRDGASMAGVIRDSPGDQSHVFLLDRIVLELMGKVALGFHVFSK